MSDIKGRLTADKQHLVDDWNQEHALFLAEGADTNMFQTMMPKPPNVATVYPLSERKPTIEVDIPESWSESDTIYVYVFDFSSPDSGLIEKKYGVEQILKNIQGKKRKIPNEERKEKAKQKQLEKDKERERLGKEKDKRADERRKKQEEKDNKREQYANIIVFWPKNSFKYGEEY